MKSLKNPPALVIFALFAFTFLGKPEIKAQTLPFLWSDFSLSMYFYRTEINLGYYPSWGGDLWLGREPYEASFEGKIFPRPKLNDSYPAKLVVYINHSDFTKYIIMGLPPSKSGNNAFQNLTPAKEDFEQGNVIQIGSLYFKKPAGIEEFANDPVRNPNNISVKNLSQMSRFADRNSKDHFLAKLAERTNIVRDPENPPAKNIPIENPFEEPFWRNDYIAIDANNDCVLKQGEFTTCKLDMLTHKIHYDSSMGMFFLCEGENEAQCSDDKNTNFWINPLAWAVVEVENPEHDPSDPASQEYLPIDAIDQGVGNLEFVILDADASLSVFDEETHTSKVDFNYNVQTSIPEGVNAYFVIFKKEIETCSFTYTDEQHNSIYDAIYNGRNDGDGGIEAGFNKFKEVILELCESDKIIGFVNLTPPGGWPDRWDGFNTPVAFTLSDREDGRPFVVDKEKNTTLASGGTFQTVLLNISGGSKALRTLPYGYFPGQLRAAYLKFPACTPEYPGHVCDPGAPPNPPEAIDKPNIADIIEFHGNAVVINESGKGVFRLYDLMGRLVTEIAVSGKTSIDLRPYQQNTAMYIFNYTNDKGSFSRKVIGGQ